MTDRSEAVRYAHSLGLHPAILAHHLEALTGEKPGRAEPSSSIRPGNCIHLGKVLDRNNSAGVSCGCEGKWLRECDLRNRCTVNDYRPGIASCQSCSDYVDPNSTLEFLPPIPAGVVIGSYGLPRLIEVQIRLIRLHCGPVPILITDDCTDGTTRTPLESSAFGQLSRMSREYPGVTLWSNPQRIGHAGGDLTALFVGLQWAAANGLRVLAKLSQRFLIDRPRWLQDGAAELLASGLGTGSQPCKEGNSHFAIRSEAMLMDVAKWGRADVLDHLRPRPLSIADTRKTPGIAAEVVIWDDIRDRINPPGRMHPWSIMQADRCIPDPGIIWHCSAGQDRYREIAQRFGLSLDDTFTCAGWQAQKDYKW